MRWLCRAIPLASGAVAFVAPGLTPTTSAFSLRRNLDASKHTSTLQPRHPPSTRSPCRSTADDENTVSRQDASTEEGELPEAEGVADIDLDELLKGLNIASPQKAYQGGTAGKGDIDEMKLIIALRKQMGEEDFYAVFDPRNPRIGDL